MSMSDKIKSIVNFSIGILILVFDLCLFISIYSYNELDSSFNSFSNINSGAYNSLGTFGSYTADIFLQFFGIVSYFIVFALAFVGINLIKITLNTNKNNKNFIYNPYLKIIMFIIYIIASSGLMEKCFVDSRFDISGGLVGKTIENSLKWLNGWFIGIIYVILILLALNIIIEFNYKKTYGVLKFIFKLIFTIIKYIFITIKFITKKIFYFILPTSMFDVIKNKYTTIKKFFTEKSDRKKQQEIENNRLFEEANRKIAFLEKYIQEIQDKKTISNLELDKRLEDNKKIVEKITETRDRKGDFGRYKLPPYELLNLPNEKNNVFINREDLDEMSKDLLEAFNYMEIGGRIVKINVGPVITLFEFEANNGIKSSRLISSGTADDVARYLRVPFVRISLIPERNVFGVEVPNKKRNTVFLRSILESSVYRNENLKLQIVLGVDISGRPVITSLADCPHMLIAGTTGSGKSVSINAIILSLLFRYHYEECRLVLIDPKMVEFNRYDGIPNLLFPVITEMPKVIMALKWLVNEMDKRYSMMMGLRVNNISDYNEQVERAINSGKTLKINIITGYDRNNEPIYDVVEAEKIPYIVVVIDEYAELMTTVRKDTEILIQRLAQKARASGIHLIIATQRPSANVITGVIKLNFPVKISFRVGGKIDSRVVLGEAGAEKLLGKGDMLHNIFNGGSLSRAHAPYVSNEEIEKVIEFIKKQNIKPNYANIMGNQNNSDNSSPDIVVNGKNISNNDDSLYQQALEIFRTEKRISGSYLQRRLGIGYNKAADLVERAEREGIIRVGVNGKKELVEQ